MIHVVHRFLARLDEVYRSEDYISGRKARLLVGFNALLIVFVPLNIAKLFVVRTPDTDLAMRLMINGAIAVAALLSLRWLMRGRLKLAGNAFAVVLLLPTHGLVFLGPEIVDRFGGAIQLYAFDVVFLLLALIFGSRWVAIMVLTVVVGSHLYIRSAIVAGLSLTDPLRSAANTLARDGLIALGFIFCLGLVLMMMIEAAHLRSEESLRATRKLNADLERLVHDRTKELEAATDAAQRALRVKGEFLANMSHEIRTPLNGIIASADLLRRQAHLDNDVREHVGMIVESGDLLLHLLGDILDLSKMESGQLRLEQHSFALDHLASGCVRLMTSRAQSNGVHLSLSTAKDIPSQCTGDSLRLRQVLLNLISNAIKFTPSPGNVWIVIARGEGSGGQPWIKFSVRDSGIGMDAETLQRIFERFIQADTSTTRRYGGSGLGLAISARLVQMMGGRLEAISEPGNGSTFYFTIPLSEAVICEFPPAPANSNQNVALNLRVLVAEDNAMNVKILSRQLTALGCTATVVGNGEAALAALRENPLPDVVLMDCHMPILDGWSATQRLRSWRDASDSTVTAQMREASELPIVALTAAALIEEQIRCAEAGMNGFVAKPAKAADLRAALEPYARVVHGHKVAAHPA